MGDLRSATRAQLREGATGVEAGRSWNFVRDTVGHVDLQGVIGISREGERESERERERERYIYIFLYRGIYAQGRII